MHKSLYHCNIELELYTPNTIDYAPISKPMIIGCRNTIIEETLMIYRV